MYTDEDVKRLAYVKWQEKVRLGIPDANNAEKNYQEAKETLETIERIHRGTIGD